MTSAIDPTKPITGAPTTQSVRDNFAAAKNEIQALNGQLGFADYADTSTSVTPISVSPSTWTKLTNNGAGPTTLRKLPMGVTDLWNTSTSQFALAQLPLFSMVEIRVDIVLTTSSANQVGQLRASMAIGDAIAFQIPIGEFFFKTAGLHAVITSFPIYIGSDPVRTKPGELQIFSDASCTVKVNGWYIKAAEYLGA
jgi:hypothetical protein